MSEPLVAFRSEENLAECQVSGTIRTEPHRSETRGGQLRSQSPGESPGSARHSGITAALPCAEVLPCLSLSDERVDDVGMRSLSSAGRLSRVAQRSTTSLWLSRLGTSCSRQEDAGPAIGTRVRLPAAARPVARPGGLR